MKTLVFPEKKRLSPVANFTEVDRVLVTEDDRVTTRGAELHAPGVFEYLCKIRIQYPNALFHAQVRQQNGSGKPPYALYIDIYTEGPRSNETRWFPITPGENPHPDRAEIVSVLKIAEATLVETGA